MFHLTYENFDRLLSALQELGYTTVGPSAQDEAIVYKEVLTRADFPQGISDVQEKGEYRLKLNQSKSLFAYAVGPHTWRKFFDPPKRKLWSMDRKTFEPIEAPEDESSYALIGVKACELEAIKIQDKIYSGEVYKDSLYTHLRERSFIIGVHCYSPSATCFCPSMGTGPHFGEGTDIIMTEVLGDEHYFILQPKSSRGREVIDRLELKIETSDAEKIIDEQLQSTCEKIERELNPIGIKDLLYSQRESKHWDTVAETCLSCANCTLVCPTCFCSTVEDVVDLTGDHAERWQKWDSCFTSDFSYVHGGVVRESITSRYRQWMTHKLASWQDQFGMSGCVGCGRCITWCPVGIDITESVQLFEQEKEK